MKIDYSIFNIISKEELKKITIKKGENIFFSKDTILLTHKIIKKDFIDLISIDLNIIFNKDYDLFFDNFEEEIEIILIRAEKYFFVFAPYTISEYKELYFFNSKKIAYINILFEDNDSSFRDFLNIYNKELKKQLENKILYKLKKHIEKRKK
ncbi:hypothetical protein N5U55_03050 [Aliarcobacter butzleri]|uniref:hypothetical protein n=1 Tax=Aliarcobacter butzleri TaxID=28197 RepID=UPI0021B3EF95|nr:hypothetical protein [Aliarcobacter butzleri]MCT7583090.1 hypothetical protein [Aliarcobacter butzleri]